MIEEQTAEQEELAEKTMRPPEERRPSWYLQKRGWAKGAAVRNKDQKPVQVNEPRQASYCLNGAIAVAEHAGGITALEAALLRATLARLLGAETTSKKMEIGTIIHWNDEICSFAPTAASLMQIAERMALDGDTLSEVSDWCAQTSIPWEAMDKLCLLREKEEAVATTD